MSSTSRIIVAALVSSVVAGCVSPDRSDDFVLGAATDANIAMHSVRDVTLPNDAPVTGKRGADAGAAVNQLKTRTAGGER
ncbi:MAG: hypothetical protein AAFU66_08795 [Pseudomonadota bacterium]